MSRLEKQFAIYWQGLSGPKLTPEHKFHPTRKWRFDFAHIEKRVAIEIEGGTWMQGGHSRGRGYQEDCEKYNEAVRLGWRVFRLTGKMITVQNVGNIIAEVIK
jgi:very-short-patch-repair endonuclease